jgi:transcription elongation factor S-II
MNSVFRANVRARLAEVADVSAPNIEIGIFNSTIQVCHEKQLVKKWANPKFREIYLAKLRTVLYNLKNTPSLLPRIRAEPQKVAFMTHQEMAPEKWVDLIDKKNKRQVHSMTQTIAATTDLFKCFKCNSKKCTYYQLQTRSADEPMTTYVTCVECENRWRC